ncbi:transcription factor IIA, alpha/beta subunit-domain-containing protein [Mycena sp. CBHHK59/15]|nr:transcription factor IIA, alpha/beta subunit-domain-containing protein [Mycena sp. CBHHK59/15]
MPSSRMNVRVEFGISSPYLLKAARARKLTDIKERVKDDVSFSQALADLICARIGLLRNIIKKLAVAKVPIYYQLTADGVTPHDVRERVGAALADENATRSMPGPAQLTEEILPFHPGFPPYIPQIDGSPDNSTDDVNSKYPTHPPHQPLAEPATSPESINSDLDDSDTDEEDAEDSVGGNLNTMFCNFEKVSRNKAKWKCVLKNGVIHANGKDYLFSRCTGGFDWRELEHPYEGPFPTFRPVSDAAESVTAS